MSESRVKTLMVFLFAVIAASGSAMAQQLDRVQIVVFGPPSLGAFLPPVIKAHKLDEKNGLSIDFQQRPPTAYTAQFNSGEFKVGGSAALLTVGLADRRGVRVAYLFNLFDYWGAIVTSRPEVKTLKDLEGREVAAASATTNFRMFEWLAGQQGVELSKMSVVNTATPGLVGYALADRAAAVQLWEPAYTVLKAKKPGLRMLDLKIDESWKKFAGSTSIPYLGVAAHLDWVKAHAALIPKLYAAYKDAADWTSAHPDEAAKLIQAKGTAEDQKAVADLIRANDRLGMHVAWASALRKEIESVYAVGRSIKFLDGAPSAETVYQAPSK
ncbi:MAG: ABC transporter substrate-binding protein [Burkholderiales bacterium]